MIKLLKHIYQSWHQTKRFVIKMTKHVCNNKNLNTFIVCIRLHSGSTASQKISSLRNWLTTPSKPEFACNFTTRVSLFQHFASAVTNTVLRIPSPRNFPCSFVNNLTSTRKYQINLRRLVDAVNWTQYTHLIRTFASITRAWWKINTLVRLSLIHI